MHPARLPGPLAALGLQLRLHSWRLLGQDSLVLQTWREAATRWPDWADASESYAFALAVAGQTQAATEVLQDLLHRSPQRARAWFNLGFLWQQHPHLATHGQSAQAALQQATALDPQNDRAWYGLGLEHLAKLQLDEALLCFGHCTRLQPMSPEAWYQLGRVHQLRGELDSARQVLARLETFDPRVSAQLRAELDAA